MAEENKELTREQEGALEAEREDAAPAGQEPEEIGRASCRERV